MRKLFVVCGVLLGATPPAFAQDVYVVRTYRTCGRSRVTEFKCVSTNPQPCPPAAVSSGGAVPIANVLPQPRPVIGPGGEAPTFQLPQPRPNVPQVGPRQTPVQPPQPPPAIPHNVIGVRQPNEVQHPNEPPQPNPLVQRLPSPAGSPLQLTARNWQGGRVFTDGNGRTWQLVAPQVVSQISAQLSGWPLQTDGGPLYFLTTDQKLFKNAPQAAVKNSPAVR